MPPPRISTCIIAEGMRREVGNKITLLGIFGVTPHVEVLLDRFPARIKMTFVFSGEPVSAPVEFGMRVTGPNGRLLVDAPNLVTVKASDPPHAGMMVAIDGELDILESGAYQVDALLGGTTSYKAPFRIAMRLPSDSPPIGFLG